MKRIALALVLVLLLTGCSDKALRVAATCITNLSFFSSSIRISTTNALNAKIISKHTASEIFKVCSITDKFTADASVLLKGITSLDPESRKKLATLLTPVIQSLDSSNLTFLEEIQDVELRKKIVGYIFLAQIATIALQQALQISQS